MSGMIITFSPIDEPTARAIARWRYEPPYDIYNLEDSAESIQYALDTQYNYHVMLNQDSELVGFCSFGEDGQVPGGDYSAKALDIGMGIRPDLTGRGHGRNFASAVLNFAQKTFHPTTFRVTIAAFNRRARRVWEKNGFKQIQTFTNQDSQREFIVMSGGVNLNLRSNEQRNA